MVNFVFLFQMNIELAKVFGKSTGFAAGLTVFPVIFWSILAFGKVDYIDNWPEGDRRFNILDAGLEPW